MLPLFEVDPLTWNIEPECAGINNVTTLPEPSTRASIALFLTCTFTPIHIVWLVLMYKYRREYPLNKRDNSMVLLMGLASLSSIYNNWWRDVYGTYMYSCDEYLPHAMVWLPAQIGPNVIRLVNIRNRLLFNKQKQGYNLEASSAANESAKRMLMRLKKTTRKRHTFFLCVVLLMPSMAIILVRATTSTRYFHGCLGCFITNDETLFFMACGIVGIGASLWTMRKLKKVDPTVTELDEIRKSSTAGLVLGVAFGIITTTVGGAIPFAINTSVLLNLIGIYGQYLSCWLPTKLAMKTSKKKSSRKVETDVSSIGSSLSNGKQSKPKDLLAIIETVEGMAAFTEHVTKEYNVENIKFWHDVVLWKRDYTLSRASPSDLKKRSFNIFNAYVPDSALLQVNLDNSQRITLEELFKDALNNDKLVAVDAFDEAEEEILNLMIRDSFPRFKASPAYPEFVEKVWPTAEDW